MIGSRYEIEGRTVFLTGAAAGIGAETARQLIGRGAQIALVDRDADGIEARAAELGDRALALTADVTDSAALEKAVKATIERFGGIDVAIANAGISGTPATVRTIDPAEFERVIEIDLLGVWRTTRAVLPHVVERKGYLLPIASVAALIPGPLIAAYVAAKHGVDGFARSLRIELQPTGTKVGVGYFGLIDTPMVRNAMAHPVIDQLNTLPSFLTRPLPVSAAGEAIVRGIERRAKKVYAPRWVPALIAVHGLARPFEELAARDPRVRKALRDAEQTPAPAAERSS